jgi:glycosyltransferase involved in cell wall biosynthesis
MPLLSIVTITYNAELYLERTILSIVSAAAQGHFDFEYLIIDGKSKDKTLEIANKYAQHITKISSEPDRGLYDAMNKGLQMAQGEYVWFMNAGDELHDEQVLLKLFARFAQNADVYYSDALFVQNDGSPVGLRSRITPHRLPQSLRWQDFATGMKVCHQAFVVRRRIAPLYDIANLSADVDWEINCLKKSQLNVCLDFVLCKYLVGGLSVQQHRRSLTDRFKVLAKHFGWAGAIFNHLLILKNAVLHRFIRDSWHD